MKTCPNCGAQLEDTVAFCPDCGNSFTGAAPASALAAPVFDPYDHTAEFEAKDISDNKIFCMLPYLLSVIGIIIALIASSESPFTRFHVREAVKLAVCDALIAFVTTVLCWTIIVPIVGGIALAVLFVVKIICFIRICKGQAKEAPIVCKLSFLR